MSVHECANVHTGNGDQGRERMVCTGICSMSTGGLQISLKVLSASQHLCSYINQLIWSHSVHSVGCCVC